MAYLISCFQRIKKKSNFLSTYWQVISLVKILTENPIWDKVNQKILFLSSYIEIPGSNLTCFFPFPEIFICEQNICENDLTKSQILPAPGNSKINRWPFNPLFTGGGGGFTSPILKSSTILREGKFWVQNHIVNLSLCIDCVLGPFFYHFDTIHRV